MQYTHSFLPWTLKVLPPKASGIRSMLYLRCEMNMMGTPGILRIRRFKSLSHVATM